MRVRGEWAVLLWSIVGIGIAAPVLSFVFPLVSSFKEIALLLIGAMIYVTLARGRLIGSSIRVNAGQLGHVHEIALECSRALQMSAPNIFVRDDPLVPIVAVGIGEPYSLIISAQWVEHMTPGELRFLIGRELAHIEAGHTRLTSLLSVNGRENAIVSVLFGAWLRRIEYTADRVGLLCCASLDDALAAISLSSFHLVARKIDLAAFAEQQRELEAERALRIGEWISSTPYATKRIAALQAFARAALFLSWSARFERARQTPWQQPPTATAVSRRSYAGFPRRCCAFFIDAIIVAAIVPALPLKAFIDQSRHAGELPAPLLAAAQTPTVVHAVGLLESSLGNVFFCIYVIGLVAIAGQTLGMMIVDVRVVTDRFGRVNIGRVLWRYACLVGSIVSVIGLVRIFSRVQPFERWSGTRLIESATYARQRRAAMQSRETTRYGVAVRDVPPPAETAGEAL